MENKNKPARINKDCVIRIRVTAEEREEFLKKSVEKGYKSVSDYIRSLVRDDDKPDTRFMS